MGEVSSEEVLKSLKEIASISLIVLYGLGFIYYSQFFSVFGVNIEFYITLSDIFYFPLASISKIILYSITFRIISALIVEGIKSSKSNKSKKEKEMLGYDIEAFISVGGLILISLITYFFDWGINRELFFLFPYLIARLFELAEYVNSYGEKRFPYIALLTFCTAIVFFVYYLGGKDAQNIIDGGNTIDVEFISEGNLISTENSKYDFIGETSQFLFIYDSELAKSSIFRKEEIKKIVIINSKKNASKSI